MSGALEIGIAIAACGFATWLWRGLGVLLSGRLDPRSAMFEWVSCVAYALVAGLIARIIVAPSGLLAQTALKRIGQPEDIAQAVRYLALEAPYVTGQILAVDGGRTLY